MGRADSLAMLNEQLVQGYEEVLEQNKTLRKERDEMRDIMIRAVGKVEEILQWKRKAAALDWLEEYLGKCFEMVEIYKQTDGSVMIDDPHGIQDCACGNSILEAIEAAMEQEHDS